MVKALKKLFLRYSASAKEAQVVDIEIVRFTVKDSQEMLSTQSLITIRNFQ